MEVMKRVVERDCAEARDDVGYCRYHNNCRGESPEWKGEIPTDNILGCRIFKFSSCYGEILIAIQKGTLHAAAGLEWGEDNNPDYPDHGIVWLDAYLKGVR